MYEDSGSNLQFKDTSFGSVLTSLGKFYNVTFEIENTNIEKCQLTANFNDEELEKVMSTLSVIFDVEFELISDQLYLVKGIGCHQD